MTFYSSDSFEVLEFFPYPSYVQMQVNSLDDWDKKGDPGVKRFFYEIFNEVQKKLERKNLMDNKIAIKIKYKATGSILYVGYKDEKYTLGLDVFSEAESIKL